MKRSFLPPSFYQRPTLSVAPQLLGKILCRQHRGILTCGRIVEVEAYLGRQDPASHAYRGPTRRNASMFGPGGIAYVYFTYGAHFCVNVVTEKEATPGAVLIRALEPLCGIPTMQRRRKRTKLAQLASGPGKLAQALAIDQTLDGASLADSALWIYPEPDEKPVKWTTTPRVGIRQGKELLYRFLLTGSSFVSKGAQVLEK